MYLEELIENVELESDKFECKSRLNREDVVGWLKSIAGFDLHGGVFTPVPHGTVYDAKILSFCYYQAHKVSEIAEYLGVSDSTYFRKQVLENLAENQYLERSKVLRAVYYKTNPKMVRIQ